MCLDPFTAGSASIERGRGQQRPSWGLDFDCVLNTHEVRCFGRVQHGTGQNDLEMHITTQTLFISDIGSLPHYDRCLRAIASNGYLATSGMSVGRTRALLPITKLYVLSVLASLDRSASGLRHDARLFRSIAFCIATVRCARTPHGNAQEASLSSLHEQT